MLVKTNTPDFRDSSQSDVRGTLFHDYNIRVCDNNSIYLDTTFKQETENSPYIGLFYHEEPHLLSIELPTKDEYLISLVTSLCKSITENMIELDNVLTALNDTENSNDDNYGCFRNFK